MATLIANADANFTGAATWAAAEAGANALAMIRNTSSSSFAAAGTATSSTFTVTSGKVIDAVLLFVYRNDSGAAANGTFKVDLQKGGVSQASVTVDKADLPTYKDGVAANSLAPVLFKLTSTATGDGGSNWTIVVTTTGTTVIGRWQNSATASDWTRALRTTTAMTLAAGDNWLVCAELTGQGTKTNRTVTMDSTAATDYCNGSVNTTSVYGGLGAVGWYGTLAYGTSSATNYILRMSGDLIVFQNGTLDIGGSGCPRNSTMVLEFDQVSADGDFGLRNLHGNVLGTGLSRTSGKNVVQCKLTADAAGGTESAHGTTNLTSTASAAAGANGISLTAYSAAETATNATHSAYVQQPVTAANDTVSASVWVARGPGTNNRFLRFIVGNNQIVGSITNGFYSDIDLQAGTAGTVTAVGAGTATSVSITPLGTGYLIRITGKINNLAANTAYAHLAVCSAAGTTSFAGSNTVAIYYEHFSFIQSSAQADTVYSVSADTGWLSGDLVCIASTSRVSSQCEPAVLSADAGSSSFTALMHPLGYPYTTGFVSAAINKHSGSSPTQAEVGLLTRNVKIRSTSSSLMTYIYCTALSTMTLSWVEIYYCGTTGVSNKRGIEVDLTSSGTAGAKSVTYCSFHDGEASAIYFNNSNSVSANVTFSNNVIWNMQDRPFRLIGNVTAGDVTADSNLVIKCAGSYCYEIGELGITFTNNVATGGLVGFGFTEASNSSGNPVGTISGNSAHSCNTNGAVWQADSAIGTIESLSLWRNNSGGMNSSSVNMADLVFNNLTVFGNASNITAWAASHLNITGNSIIAGDTVYSTNTAMSFTTVHIVEISLDNVDFSGTTSIFAPHATSEFDFTTVSNLRTVRGTIRNCKFGAPNLISTGSTAGKGAWTKDSYLSFQQYNQVAGDHRTEMKYGQIKTDTSIYNAASPSMRMTPNNASSKLESAPKGRGKLFAIDSGQSLTISASVRKSAAGDGAAYSGNQPRLIARANLAIGINADTVLATYSASTGSWNSLSGATPTATDDGAVEVIVDCDGVAGWVNVEDWAAAA